MSDYCAGHDAWFKQGYEAGFKAALNTFSMKLHDLGHEISFFTDEQIEARYQEWFGPDRQAVLPVFDEGTDEDEALAAAYDDKCNQAYDAWKDEQV